MATYVNVALLPDTRAQHLPDYNDFQASMNTNNYWRDQSQRKRSVEQELLEQIKKRRMLYNDLNDLLEKKERVASLSRAMPERDSVQESRDEKEAYTPRVFIKPAQLDEAIEVALETGCRVHGSQEGVTKKEILQFVKTTFQLTEKQIEQAQERSSQQPPKLRLMCKVIKATDLKPNKVGHGVQRNPYCQMGIVNQKHYHPGSEFKYMSKWKKNGEVNNIATTDFRTATLEPVWNQDIQLAVGNIEEEVVVVEVWDHSPEASAKKKKDWSLKGLLTPNKEDFLGWMFHPLLLVPIAGAELKVTLMSRGKKPLNGFITLFLSIQADTDDKPLEARLSEHHVLTQALVDCLSKGEDGDRKDNWNGQLCSYSEKLLEYHGALNGLNKLEMACVQFSELLNYHQFQAVDMRAFSEAIQKMKQLQLLFPVMRKTSTYYRDHSALFSPSPPPYYSATDQPDLSEPEDTQWMEQLFSELHVLEAELIQTMNDHIRFVHFKLEGKSERLSSHLSTLLELYTFEAFVSHMDPRRELRPQLERCIEPSVDNWFSMVKEIVMPTGGTEPKQLRDLCVHCLFWSEKVLQQLNLHHSFSQAGVDYFTLYMKSLDQRLSKEAKRALQEYRKQKPDTITFEIYTNFQHLVKLSENVKENVRAELEILGFHKWFKKFIPGWIDVATEKCEARIRQAIELDEVVQITDEIKLSASAVDTNGFLLQMTAFWKHLDWPVASEAYCYAISLVEKICSCASLYIEVVSASLSPDDVCDEHGSFKPSDKLCLVLNNMFHVRDQLTELPEHMELEKLYEWLRREDLKKYLLVEEGGPEADEMYSDPLRRFNVKAKHLIKEFLTHADEHIIKMIDDLVRRICQKVSEIKPIRVRPDIQTLIIGIVHSNANVNDYTVIAPLFDYLMQNLLSLGGNLLSPAFQNITANLWRVSIEAIEDISDMSRKRNIPVQQRLFNLLKLLREFFYCEGAGVSGKALDIEGYFSLLSKLEILSMPTQLLILRFYCDILIRQHSENRGDRKFGELLLSIGYIKETSMIEVTVIHGDNMKTIVEPYVKVRLSSTCRASGKHWKTRPVKGLQKAPLFNEDLNLTVSEEEMNSEGTLVFFYLLDKRLRTRIPHGMCAVACKNIPQLPVSSKSSLMDPLAPQRKNFRLQLFRFTSETPALTELISRSDYRDGMAVNFLKSNQLLFSGIPHMNFQPQSNAIGHLIRRTKSMIVH